MHGGRVGGRGTGVTVLVVYVPVHDAAVVGKTSKVVEHVSAVLALVDLVPAMCLDVGPEVVPTRIPAAAYVTRKWLLTRVDAHVATEVRRSDELAAAHVADKRPVRFLFLVQQYRVVGVGIVYVFHGNNLRLDEVFRHRFQQGVVLWGCHGSKEVEIAARANRLVGSG